METVKTTIELQEYTPPSKSIPKWTFWALVLAAEYLYDNNTKYKINSHGQFYKDVYRLDAQLETSSSAQQHIDIQTAKNNSANAHMDEDEIKAAFAPDKNYYWSNCRYMTDSNPRTNRKNVLIDEIVKGIQTGDISSIVPPTISTSAVAKWKHPCDIPAANPVPSNISYPTSPKVSSEFARHSSGVAQ